jgi:hypothetical protein
MLLFSQQSYEIAPHKKPTLLKIKMILMMSGGQLVSCHIYCALLKPLNSCLRGGPIAKAPYFNANTQPIRCQINSSCEEAGGMWGCFSVLHTEIITKIRHG